MIYDDYDFSNFSKDKAYELEVELRKLLDSNDYVEATFLDLKTDADIDIVLKFIRDNEGKMTRKELYESVLVMTVKMEEVSRKFSKEKNEELVQALRGIFDNDMFILGMRCSLKNDEEIDKVLSFIKEHEGVDSSDDILSSVADRFL